MTHPVDQMRDEMARLTIDPANVSSFAMSIENTMQPLPSPGPWITPGNFEVTGTMTVHFPFPVGLFRQRGGRRVFLEAVRPHMTKRRFRRLRGKVKAAVRRARA